jgi:predicted MPP superfamily phosphohydrolase
VLGNHDNWDGRAESQAALAEAGITEVTNTGVWIERGGARLRVSGVGDLWTDRQDLGAALGDASDRDAVLLLAHNPDYVETLTDRRVGLVLSGHTHGGQIVLPRYGAPIVPSQYGQKYLQGLVQGPACRVFVTRGVGTVTPPVRFHCRPEVALLTLTSLG